MRRLQLEKFGPNDFELYYQLVGNGTVMADIYGRALTRQEGLEAFQEALCKNSLHPDLGRFRAYDAATGAFLGLAQLSLEEADATEAELELLLLPCYWGLRYARDLLTLLLELASSVDQLHEIVSVINPQNPATVKLLSATGFERERSFVQEGRELWVMVRGEVDEAGPQRAAQDLVERVRPEPSDSAKTE